MISKEMCALAVLNGCVLGLVSYLYNPDKSEILPSAVLLAADTFAAGFFLKKNNEAAAACTVLGSVSVMYHVYNEGVGGDHGLGMMAGLAVFLHTLAGLVITSELGVAWAGKQVVQYVF